MAQHGNRSVQRPKQTITNEQINGYLRNRLRKYNARDTKAILTSTLGHFQGTETAPFCCIGN